MTKKKPALRYVTRALVDNGQHQKRTAAEEAKDELLETKKGIHTTAIKLKR